MNTSALTEPVAAIYSALAANEKAIADLELLVDRLAMKAAPFMIPESVKNKSETAVMEPRPIMSPMRGCITDATNRVQVIHMRIQEIIGRIEV